MQGRPTFAAVDKDQQIADLIAMNKQLLAQITQLTFELGEMKRLLFGRKSERFVPENPVSPPQLDLVLLMQEATRQPTVTPEVVVVKKKTPAHKPTGRQPLPDHLERINIYLEPAADTQGYQKIGEECTEQLDYKPGSLLVRRYIRPKYAKTSADGTTTEVLVAPLPDFTIEKGMAAPGLLAQIIVDKFCDHLPVYRQIKRYQRQGVKLAASTINGWMEALAALLEPLGVELIKQVLQSGYVQADETPLPVLDGETKGAAHRGFLWAYHSPARQLIFYDYQPGRSKKGPVNLLKDFNGYLQTDGYGAYDSADIGGRQGIILIHCMAHTRRYFEKALPTDKDRAEYFLGEVQKLYAIEQRCREENFSSDQILAIRKEEAIAVLASLHQWLKQQYEPNAPTGPIEKAIAYALKRWDKLSLYTADARLQIDNNLIENAMRAPVLGRKNFLFAGSNEGGKRLALFYSLMESVKKHKLNPWEYLSDILERMPTTKTSQLRSLLPDQWKPLEK